MLYSGKAQACSSVEHPWFGRAGNTCFINSALQLICHTPGLAELLVPSLLDAPAPSDSAAGEAGASSGAQQEPAAQHPLPPLPAAAAASAGEPDLAAGGTVEPAPAARALEAGEALCLIRSSPVADMPVLPSLPTITEAHSVVPDVLPLPLQPNLALACTAAAAAAASSTTASLCSESSETVTHPQPPAPASAGGRAAGAEGRASCLEDITTGAAQEGHWSDAGAAAQHRPEQSLGPHTPANSDAAPPPPSLSASPEAAWGHTAAPPAHSAPAAHGAPGAAAEEPRGGSGEAAAPAEAAPRSEPASAAGPPATEDPATAQAVGRTQAEQATAEAAGSASGAAVTPGADGDAGVRQGEQGAAAQQPDQAPAAAAAPKHPPLRSGELAAIFEQLLRQVRPSSPFLCFTPVFHPSQIKHCMGPVPWGGGVCRVSGGRLRISVCVTTASTPVQP